MYKWFEVRNFRCFQHLRIDGLERVNLIAGVNNVGKTALLEALFLHSGAYKPELTMTINHLRGIEKAKIEFTRPIGETVWDSIFEDFDLSQTVELVGDIEATGERVLRLRVLREPEELAASGQFARIAGPPDSPSSGSPLGPVGRSVEFVPRGETGPKGMHTLWEAAQVLELEYEEVGRRGKHYMIVDAGGMRIGPPSPPAPIPGFYQTDRASRDFEIEAERFTKLRKMGRHDRVVEFLKIVEPRLRSVEVHVEAGVTMLEGDIGPPHPIMPLALMGGGMVRAASLVLFLGLASNSVVLIDEIDNGLHHSILVEIWQTIGELAREFDAQVFATTHSHECILAAHRAFSDSGEYDFRLHRLERAEDETRAISYGREALEAAIEAGLEVR